MPTKFYYDPERDDIVKEEGNNFASALSEYKYPKGEIPLALVSLNEIKKMGNNNVIEILLSSLRNNKQNTSNSNFFAKNNNISTKNNDFLAKNNDYSAKNNESFANNYQVSTKNLPKNQLKLGKNGKILGLIYNPEIHLYKTHILKRADYYQKGTDINLLLINIENKLNKVLKNKIAQTNKTEVKNYYNQCLALANQSEVTGLFYKLEDIDTWIENQAKGHATAAKKKQKKKNKRIRSLTFVILLSIIIPMCILFVKHKITKFKNNRSYSTEQISEQNNLEIPNLSKPTLFNKNNKNIYTRTQVEQYIQEYSTKNKKTVYQYRKDLIYNSISNEKITNKRLIFVIDSFIKETPTKF